MGDNVPDPLQTFESVGFTDNIMSEVSISMVLLYSSVLFCAASYQGLGEWALLVPWAGPVWAVCHDRRGDPSLPMWLARWH